MGKIGKLSEFKKDLLSIIFLTSLSFIFFIKLFLPQSSFFVTPDLGHTDSLYETITKEYTLSSSTKEKKIPLWTNRVGTGHSLIGESQFVTYNLVNLFLYYFFSSSIAAGLQYVFFLFLATTSSYLLGRFLCLNRFSSVFCAVCFSTSGFFIFRITHINFFEAFALVPFVYLFTFRILKQGQMLNVLLLSFFIAQQILIGHSQIVILEMLSIAISLVYLSIKNKDEWGKNVSGMFLVCGAVFFGVILTSIQFFPFLEFKNESTRSTGISFDTVTADSLSPKLLPTLIYPFAFGSPVDATYRLYKDDQFDIFWEKMGYIGLVPFVFILISLFVKKKDKPVYFSLFIVVGSIGLLLSLGKYGPLFFLYHLPPFSYFRGAARSLFLVDFSASILAGYGLQWFLEEMKRRNIRLNLITLGVLLISLTFIPSYLITYYYHPVVETQKILGPPESAQYIKDKNYRTYTLGSGAPYMNQLLSLGWQDYSYYLYAINSLEPNLSLLYGFNSTGVYAGARTKRQDFLQTLIANSAIGNLENYTALATPLHKGLLNMTSTKYLISPFKINDADLPLRHTIIPPNKSWQPFYIYENLNVLPRVRILSDYIDSASLENSEQLLKSDNFDPKKQVILEGDLSKKFEKANSSATMVRDNNETLDIDTDTDKDGLLVLADSYYPGWYAYVDGVQTQIYPANVNQRAIVLPQGKHDVKFVYDPDSFRTGKRISIIAWIMWGILLVGVVAHKIKKKINV